MSDDRSEITQPVHGLDVGLGVVAEIPSSTEVFDPLTGREPRRSAVVDANEVRRGRGKFAPVERGVARGDHRP